MTSHDDIAQRLHGLAEQLTQHWPIPGGIIVAVSRDTVLFERPFGLANIDARIPVGPHHLFEIGSISKVFVGLMVAELAEAGRLDLDAPVTTYLPWFVVASDYPMFTPRHLLHHTSGLVAGADAVPDELGQGWWMRDLRTGSAPGAMFHYSNIGYILLGLIVTAVAGEAATSFCRSRLLQPMGMTRTIPCVTNADRPLLAVGYAPAFDDRPWVSGDVLAPATWFEVNGADGNIATNGGDFGRFMRMLLNGGSLEGRQIVNPAGFERMTTCLAPDGEPFAGSADVEDSFYGLGINVETVRGSKCLTHGGGMVGYATFLLADPGNDVAIAVLTNANGDCPGAQFIARLGHAWLTGSDVPPPPVDLGLNSADPIGFDPGMLGAFSAYDADGKAVAFTVAAAGNRVTLSSGGTTGNVFRLWSGRYATDHQDFRIFHLAFDHTDGEPVWTYGGFELRRVPAPPVAVDENLRACVGHYRSHSPWFTNFRIVLRGKRLLLVAPGGVEAPSEDVELVELRPGVFRLGLDPRLPERLVIGPMINGKVATVDRDGNRYSRTFTP